MDVFLILEDKDNYCSDLYHPKRIFHHENLVHYVNDFLLLIYVNTAWYCYAIRFCIASII